MELDAEDKKRIAQALEQTCVTLDRALSYQEKFQDKSLVEFCRNHIKKLTYALETGIMQ